MFGSNFTPAIAAVQFLPPDEQALVGRLVEQKARRNPRFRDRLAAAKAEAERDARDYEEWLCRQAAYLETTSMEDVPW